VPLFVRIVEQPDGWWFRRGRNDIKWFGDLDEAIEHASDRAVGLRPSEVLVHYLDGRVKVIAKYE